MVGAIRTVDTMRTQARTQYQYTNTNTAQMYRIQDYRRFTGSKYVGIG
jgi:hypothetical protein